MSSYDIESQSENDKLKMIKRTFFKTMKVGSVVECFELLSMSSRIVSDLVRAIKLKDEVWDLKIAIREFIDFDLKYEFRGFYNKKLNGMTQYYTEIYFDYEKEEISKIGKEFVSFIEKISDLLPEKCVIDFVMIGSKIYVVELNPFTEQSGSMLFDWKKDEEVINNG
jgi:hypothetical protein